jgi:hypothetical protein
MQALTAAANVELAAYPEKHRVFRAVLKAADIAQEDRHKIAHWVWAACPDLPDALLLADPEFVRAQNIAQARVTEVANKSLAKILMGDDLDLPAELQGVWDINKHEVWVYAIEDLQKSLMTLHEAASVLFYFRFYMQPLRVNQLGGAPPDIEELGTSDGALHRLSSLRLFQEALARVDSLGSRREMSR